MENIYTFILFVLCGILIICFIGPYSSKQAPATIINNPAQTETKEPFVATSVADIDKVMQENMLKKILLKLFTGYETQNGAVLKANFNNLLVQTRPWTNIKYDLNIVKFPFSKEETANPESIFSMAKRQIYDIISMKPGNRSNDFYLNGKHGLDINIIFRYNYEGDYNNTVDVDAYIKELSPPDTKLSLEEQAAYKTIIFKKCKIDYNVNDPDRIQLAFTQTTAYKSQVVTNGAQVRQTYIIYLNIPGLANLLKNNTGMASVINNVIPYNSFLDYVIEWQPSGTTEFETIFNSQLYIINTKPGVVDANTYMKVNLEQQNKEILRDKYNGIITPMFMIDNSLSKLESSLDSIKDAYDFNRLNNMATQLKFYNTVDTGF